MASVRNILDRPMYSCWMCRSQWPRGLRRRSAVARLLRLWVRFLQFYGPQKLISVGTNARHLFLSFSQINPIHTESPWNPLFIILPLTPRFSKFSPSFRFPHQTLYSCLICHITATYPANFILLIRTPNHIWWGVQFMKLVIIHSSPVHWSLPFFRPKYLPQSLF
jgi:hypothetical protein